MPSQSLTKLLEQIKQNAAAYYRLTARPLGVAGEIAELEASRLLKLEILSAREAGADAKDSQGQRYQIKGRVLQPNKKTGQIGSLNFKHNWNHCLLVLMDADLQATEIWQAPRTKLLQACTAPGSKARNLRNSLSIHAFKALADQVWPSQKNVRPRNRKFSS